MKLTAEQIVDVLDLGHSRDPVVQREKRRIEQRGVEIRHDMPFSAYCKARIEWLERQMKEWREQ